MAIGAYTMAILVAQGGVLVLALAAAARSWSSMLFGVIVGLPSLRLRADYFAIATIAMAEVVRLFAQNARGLTGGNQGLFCDLDDPSNCYTNAWRDISDSINNFISNFWTDPPTLLPAAARDLGHGRAGDRRCSSTLQRTPWGRVLRAIREDEDAAQALGKNTLALQAPVAGDRGAARRDRGLLPRPRPAHDPPARLRAAGDLLRLQRADPRRPGELPGGRGGRGPLLVRARGDPVHRPAGSAVHGDAGSRLSDWRSRACC